MVEAGNSEESRGASRVSLSESVGATRNEELLNMRNSLQTPESNALSKITTRPELQKVHTQVDLERLYTAATHREDLENAPASPITPTKTSDGTILVDWYTTDDPENPQNWPSRKKILVALQI
jgi:DHA1 family multidrug resistance protein-like MFS transporter